MTTFDPMMFDSNNYSYSQQQNGNSGYGQTDYAETSAHANKEEENMYGYASSRVADRPSPANGKPTSVHASATKSPYNMESGNPGANNNHSQMSYRQESKQVPSQGQSSHTSATLPEADARQDSLLGPLFAELDSLSNQPPPQQVSTSHAPSVHSRSSVSYQSNHGRPVGSSQPNHTLSNTTHRTVTNALRDSELHNSMDPKDPLSMDENDIFMSASNVTAPGSHYNQYDPDNQVFHSASQQYNTTFDQTNARASPGPHSFKQQNTNPFINYQSASSHQTPSNNDELFSTNSNHNQRQKVSKNTQHTNQDHGGKAIWNKLQHNSGKTQEKQASNLQLPGIGRGTIKSSTTSNSYSVQQSSIGSPSPARLSYRPPVLSQPNYIEKNIGMIKNKENYYHRYPPRKYENMYSKRKNFHGENTYDNGPHEQESADQSSNLPLTMNLNTNDNSQNESTLSTDNHMNHGGENLSVDINLRLVDEQNPKQQQQQRPDQPNQHGKDALDRHIRKMERSIDQYLPPTLSSHRSPITLTTSVNPTTTRFGKVATTGYNPPNYERDSYSYSDKGQEENSYLAQMNRARRNSEFKPYTGRDYERFKKNCGFGTGHLGFDSENTTFKDKLEKATKVREYAQQIEARNKKMFVDTPYRTSSETRVLKEDSKRLRVFENPPLSKRTKQFSSKSTHSSPVSTTEIVSFSPARRPTDVLHRSSPAHRPTEVAHQVVPARRPTEIISHSPPARHPTETISHSPRARRLTQIVSHSPPARRPIIVAAPSPPARRTVEIASHPSPAPRQRIRFQEQDDDEVVQSVHRYEDRDVAPVKHTLNPPKKRREQNDENDSRYVSTDESPPPNRAPIRRLSPMKLSSPFDRVGSDNVSKRRPLRFDNLPSSDEPTHSSPQQNHIVQHHKRKSSVEQIEIPQTDDDHALMKAIRDELSVRPLQENEELVVVD